MTVSVSAFDLHMMEIALRLARRGLGRVAPNPAVGAVIVDPESGEIVGRGWTQPGGRPHAETEAIRRAGTRTRGATLYVTLEPCSHHGRTPPCADAVVSAGIARVVCAVADPDPRVSGRGFDRLRAAGIAVVRGVLSAEASAVTRGHIVRVTERRPLVQLKMALDRNGEVPKGRDGRPVWGTGELARAHGHLLRARADAIMVGAGTLAADDPDLTCRLPGMADRSPIRVVLGGAGLLATPRRLWASARDVPVWQFTAGDPGPAAMAAAQEAGVRVFRVPAVGDRLWLPAVLEALVAEGVTRLLVEGGPTLWRAFSTAGLVDEVVHYRARPSADVRHDSADPDMAPAASLADDMRRLAPGTRFRLVDRRRIGEDCVSTLRRETAPRQSAMLDTPRS